MMTKSEIIRTTLDQLIEKFQNSHGLFKYITREVENIIVWQNKVGVVDKKISDPNETERTVTITWSKIDETITVAIFNKHFDAESLNPYLADATISDRRCLERYRSNYRKFIKIKKLLYKAREHSDNKEFIAKLSSVFPTMLDSFILGK